MRGALPIVFFLTVGACGPGPRDPAETGDQAPPGTDGVANPTNDGGPTPVVGQAVSAQVLENVTACEVDAVCFLRLRIAGHTVTAIYGTGERPAPPCPVSTEVSDVAFGLEEGEVVEVLLHDCGSEGYFIESVRPAPS